MTTGCVTQTSYSSGAQLTGLTQGTSYFVEITAVPPAGFVSATSAVSASAAGATTQLAAATITGVTSSTTTAGQLTIAFTGAANAPGGQLYTATACTNAGMTTGCVTHAGYASGGQFSGLTPGTNYYVTITAAALERLPRLDDRPRSGPRLATVQLTTPTITTVAPSTTTAGALTISYTGSANAPGGQTYNATACTNVGMTTGCVTKASIASGAQITGLAAGTQLLRDPHRERLLGVPPDHDGRGRPDARDHPAHRTHRRLARLRHRRRLDRRHLHRLLQRAGRPALHRDGLHQRGDDDRVRERRDHLRREPDRPRLRAGAAGTAYYVTVTASASSGYLASPPSSVAGPQAATSQLNAPPGLTTAPSTTTAGAITATFTSSTGHRARELHGDRLHERRR